jgi:chaperonin GroEL
MKKDKHHVFKFRQPGSDFRPETVGAARVIVISNGCALLYASQDLDKVKVRGSDQKAGVAIVKSALEAPIRQITTNAGVDGSVIVGKLLEANKSSQGYDAQTEQYVDISKTFL